MSMQEKQTGTPQKRNAWTVDSVKCADNFHCLIDSLTNPYTLNTDI